MSQNAQKGQRYVELFSINNQDLLNKWKVLPNVKKVYDDKLKTFVYNLKGKSPIPLMRWSKEKTSGDLDHPILVFQMYIAIGANVLFDIGVRCHNNLRKRITLSSNQKIERVTLLSVILPFSVKNAGTWSHLLLDLEDVVSSIWKRETFKCIDSICLSGSCNIKRIFTLRRDMIHTQEGNRFIKYDLMPKQMLLSRNESVIYNIIPCSSDSEKDSKFVRSFTDETMSSSSSSHLSGHCKVARSTHGSRKSTLKSAKSSGSISQKSLSNKSKYSLHSEDTRSEDTIQDHLERISGDGIIPLLSRLSFTDTNGYLRSIAESSSNPDETKSNHSQKSESLIQDSLEMSTDALFTEFSVEHNANLHQETC